jgi:hypothetical protein
MGIPLAGVYTKKWVPRPARPSVIIYFVGIEDFLWRTNNGIHYADKCDSDFPGRATLDDCRDDNLDYLEPQTGKKAAGHFPG